MTYKLTKVPTALNDVPDILKKNHCTRTYTRHQEKTDLEPVIERFRMQFLFNTILYTTHTCFKFLCIVPLFVRTVRYMPNNRGNRCGYTYSVPDLPTRTLPLKKLFVVWRFMIYDIIVYPPMLCLCLFAHVHLYLSSVVSINAYINPPVWKKRDKLKLRRYDDGAVLWMGGSWYHCLGPKERQSLTTKRTLKTTTSRQNRTIRKTTKRWEKEKRWDEIARANTKGKVRESIVHDDDDDACAWRCVYKLHQARVRARGELGTGPVIRIKHGRVRKKWINDTTTRFQ